MDTTLDVPQGRFVLERHDRSTDPTLRAWSAADEYALAHLAAVGAAGRTLVVGDAFGALAIALDAEVSWLDSFVGARALVANASASGVPFPTVVALPDEPDGVFDIVVVRVPKSGAALDDILARLRPHLAPDAVVVGTGMTKQVHNSTIGTFERHLGPTPTSKARKKARLLLPTLDPVPVPVPGAGPATWRGPEFTRVVGLPGVFSHDRLDAGSALLLDHVDVVGADLIDLGCGTGVVGAALAHRFGTDSVRFVDESFSAVESARRTAAEVPGAAFVVTDVLDGVADDSADAVVVNPPFHAGGARTTDVARRMIDESHRVLRPGGHLYVVGNRHLDYSAPIRSRFGAHRIAGSDPTFVVHHATR